MFITRKHIHRRAFLRGAGVTLALPLLDSMVPAQTPLAKTAAVPKTRFTGIFVPHGMAPGYWVPEKPVLEAGNFPFILKPLEPFREQTVVMSGLWSKSAEPPPGVIEREPVRQLIGALDIAFESLPGVLEARERIELRTRV